VTGARSGAVAGPHRIEDVLRECAPRVLAALIRRHRQFDACEDAVQEALLAAALQWPGGGVPERPRSWLLAVASRALAGAGRADSARRRGETDTPAPLFLCCHPALSPPAQPALPLRAAGGLTTAQIAAAFLAPPATIAKRIARAKQRIRDTGARFELPARPPRTERPGVVLPVRCLIFNEGHTTSSGPALQRTGLTAEAIRLTRPLPRLLPGEAEAAGLLALMPLTDARRAARTGTDARIVPLAGQHRDLCDTAAIAEGQATLTQTPGTGPAGPCQLPAAIAALHDEAPTAQATDRPQILALSHVLATLAPGPGPHAQPRPRPRPQTPGRARPARHPRQRPADGTHPPPPSGTRPPARTNRPHHRRPPLLPPGSDDDRQPPRTTPPRTARRPAAPPRPVTVCGVPLKPWRLRLW